jgi:hypothetical protein
MEYISLFYSGRIYTCRNHRRPTSKVQFAHFDSFLKIEVQWTTIRTIWSSCWTAPAHWRDPTTAPTCGLLAAQFPAWPVAAVLSRPGHRRFLSVDHVDARLSADTCSTQVTVQQLSRPQIIRFTGPPSRRITGERHAPSRLLACIPAYLNNNFFGFLLKFKCQWNVKLNYQIKFLLANNISHRTNENNCPLRELNSRPLVYKTIALPLS